MSDSGTARHHAVPAQTGHHELPELTGPAPTAVLVVGRTAKSVLAASPAAWRWLTLRAAAPLREWLTGLDHDLGAGEPEPTAGAGAGPAPRGPGEVSLLHRWAGPEGRPGDRALLCALTTAITFQGHDCLLIAMRDPDRELVEPPVAEPAVAAFLLDPVGRVNAWSAPARRITGFGAREALGCGPALLHTAAARSTGEAHQSLNQAHVHGEHRAEGWRLRADGGLIWAQVTTTSLLDPSGWLIGFATLLRDLENAGERRGDGPLPMRPALGGRPLGTGNAGPALTGPALTGPTRGGPAPRRPARGGRTGVRVPSQRGAIEA